MGWCLQNRRLPSKFMNPDERGVSGGVEMGLMSTTTSLKTALQYTKGGRLPTIFSVSHARRAGEGGEPAGAWAGRDRAVAVRGAGCGVWGVVGGRSGRADGGGA